MTCVFSFLAAVTACELPWPVGVCAHRGGVKHGPENTVARRRRTRYGSAVVPCEEQ